MHRAVKIPALRIRIAGPPPVAIVGWVFWGLLVAASSFPSHDVAAAEPALEEQFDNPEAIVHRFSMDLGRLSRAPGLPTPEELAQQAETNKTCAVTTLPDPGQKLDAQAIYTRARAGSVILGAIAKIKKRHHPQAVFAGGFVIQRDGVIASNAHVLEAFKEMKALGVMTNDGRVFPVKAVLAADRVNDVALLKIEAKDLPVLPVAKTVPVGATVYCLSHPLINYAGTENGFFAFTQGIVSGRFRSRLMGETPINVLAITADYAQGSSGGPILNEHGAVVGMVCQTLAVSDDSGESQMTWKFARPSSSLLSLVRGERAGK